MPDPGFIAKAGAAETHGAYSVFESILPPGVPGPAPHLHTAEEAWYVIQGTLKFVVGADEFIAEAGSFVLAPRGVRHSFANLGKGPAKHLTIFSPPRDALWTAVSEMRLAAGNGSLNTEELIALYKEHGEALGALARGVE
jgi:mannose-6-phosphate isomerase-like protein (cupin superfamily)